jgi:hypothetical protein
VHPCLFDVLHDAHHDNILAIADRIDIDFGGVLEKAVDQDRLSLSDHECLGDELFELGCRSRFPSRAAEDVAGTTRIGKPIWAALWRA